MSVEIEAQFSSPQGPLLLIAWFEGGSSARLVLSLPKGRREEIQIQRLEASLAAELEELIKESATPPPSSKARVTARFQLANERTRVGRTVQLGMSPRADRMCTKLFAMAELLSKDEGVRHALVALKRDVTPRRPL